MNEAVAPARPRGALRPELRALYALSGLAGAAMGLFNPLISALMHAAGASPVDIGGSSTLFFLGVIVAAPLSGWMARRWGARRALACGLVLSALAAAQFPWHDGLGAWFALRTVMGVGVGLYMVAGQAALNGLADPRHRAVVSGLYSLAFGLGLGAGPLVGAALWSLDPKLAFATGAGLLLLGLLAVRGLPDVSTTVTAGAARLWSGLRLPLHAVFAYGIAEATLMSLYPVFLLERGHSVAQVGVAFSAFVLGGIAATLPLVHLADRHGRERVLGACALTGVVALVGLVTVQGAWLATAMSLLVGASLGPVFAIALAVVGDRVPAEQLPAGSALFTTAFSVGSMIAPLLASLSMREWGSAHVFTLSVVLFASLAVHALVCGVGPVRARS